MKFIATCVWMLVRAAAEVESRLPSFHRCPLHSHHFLSMTSLPTHGKTAVSEANQACAGNASCRQVPGCCKLALTHCGNVHVQEILQNESSHNIPVRMVPSSELLAQASDSDQLAYFAAAALHQLNDVASNPNTMPIPSASSYKPKAGRRLMPVVEMWPVSGDIPTLVSTTERWELKAIFRGAKSNSNDDVLGLLLDMSTLHVLALRGSGDRFYSECSASPSDWLRYPGQNSPRPDDGVACVPTVLQAVYFTLRDTLPPTSTLVITAHDLGAIRAGRQLTAQLANSTQIQPMYFKSEFLSVQEQEIATCTVLCPSLDATGKPRRLERQNGAEYIYVNIPGGFERSLWLAVVATLVFLGSWNGSYKINATSI
eukprot:Gregarina_sp_Poly_1__2438@NODE_1656_length_3616_cov_320_157509_g1073_i1_p2_GENE_NODE_1656_length_3616_cov_320_157509_g1073_i1NODE_1656_length_3616_cov_320_157509_g1073_i1_p2_ORF_typecomplete_len371_score25_71_NODE_1656_length_3616_cov_320_157509_g1073_i124633575